MNIGYNLNLTQEQKLIMTVEMQQSIKILQMTSYELLEYINKEIQENVVLEYDESDNGKDGKAETPEPYEYGMAVSRMEDSGYDIRRRNDDGEYVSPLEFVSTSRTLKDYLRDQVLYTDMDKRSEIICRYIIENIDSRGYLDENIVLFLQEELKITAAEAEKCLGIIQSMEPAGVGARSLRECLLLQLKAKEIGNETLRNIVKNSLVEISEGRTANIAKQYGITAEEARKYSDIIKSLEPKPSRGFFTGEDIGYIIPDVYIRKTESGYEVFYNENILPRLTVNNEYRNVLKDNKDTEALKYIKEKIEGANYLIKSIDKRRKTIIRVAEEIIKIQQENIEGEISGLKPMTIGDVSKKLEMHESTVSRAVKDKYVSLPNGRVIKMRSLFVNHLNEANSDISSAAIKRAVKLLIDKEDKHRPLSDEDICTILRARGIEISRRTVAKYRSAQNIPGSSKRRAAE